jgi:hypothetical protein
MQQWLLCLLTCNLYGWYLLYTVHTELKSYLGREDINPVVELLITFVCFPYAFVRLGRYIQEAQTRAGVAGAQDPGIGFILWFFLCWFHWSRIQEEVNKVWEGGGGAPATF